MTKRNERRSFASKYKKIIFLPKTGFLTGKFKSMGDDDSKVCFFDAKLRFALLFYEKIYLKKMPNRAPGVAHTFPAFTSRSFCD